MSYPVRGIGDPLAGLLRAERALIVAGTRGEAVAEQLQDVRNSIRAMVEQREAEPAIRIQPYERER